MGLPYVFSIDGKYEAGPVTLVVGEVFSGAGRLLAIVRWHLVGLAVLLQLVRARERAAERLRATHLGGPALGVHRIEPTFGAPGERQLGGGDRGHRARPEELRGEQELGPDEADPAQLGDG